MTDVLKAPPSPQKRVVSGERRLSDSKTLVSPTKRDSLASTKSALSTAGRVGEYFTDRDALINLEVKVLTQSLGAENQWTECGDGRVEFVEMTIRVIGNKEDEKSEEKVLLDDTINSDTPFVGENCCIVWNSFDKQLSLCLMYASEEGYMASWSALVALQEKSYPPLLFDLLARCKPTKDENGKDLEVFPYSYYLHDKYTPPLGFIHMHAFSVSIMEHEHGLNPELYKNRDVVVAMLSIANPELYEYLLNPDVYPLLVNGAIGNGVDPAKRVAKEWEVPPELSKISASDEMKTLIAKDLRLSHFLREILTPKNISSEVIMRFSTISQRLRNDLTCCLLSSDDMLSQAKDALNIIPAVNTGRSNSADPSGSIASVFSEGSNAESVTMEPAKAEQQIVAHLKLFRNVVSVSINSLGRDFVGPVIAKIFLNDLLATLSLVAERFAMPSGSAATFLSFVSSDSKSRLVSIPNYYSPAVEKELAALLDIAFVRLNERQEEILMNEIVRGPVLNKPEKYNGIMTFMLRQLLNSPSSQKKMLTDPNSLKNPFLLYHVLGLHDDEGSAASERVVDAENMNIRTRFQHHVITKYIIHASRGSLSRVPPPPTTARNQATPPITPPASTPTHSALTPIPQGITPAFIHILDYLVLLTSNANREILMKSLFSSKSHVLQFIESCCAVANKNSRVIGVDVLAGNVRFIKTVVGCLGYRNCEIDENPLNIFTMPVSDPLPKGLVSTICRQLTVERNIFGPLLQTYNSIGGNRKNTIYHSAVISLLDLVEKHLPSQKEVDEAGPFNITLRDVRDFVYLRHAKDMPPGFVKRYSDSMMNDLANRLGREDLSSSRSQSVSALSSASPSESFRSSGKLRFVDEIDAAIGGIDGQSVSPKVSGLSPSVIAGVTNEELQRKKSNKQIEMVVDQISPSNSSVHKRAPSDGSMSPMNQISPPSTQNILRPKSGSFSLEETRSPKITSSSPKTPSRIGEAEPLKPTAPKTEKPANTFRPRSLSAIEASEGTPAVTTTNTATTEPVGGKGGKENCKTTLPATGRSAVSPSSSSSSSSPTHSAPADGNVVLPKIKKRSTASPKKAPSNGTSKK